MDQREFKLLIKKYLAGNSTDVEKRFIEAYYDEMRSDATLEELLEADEINKLSAEIATNIQSRIRDPKKGVVRQLNWKRYASVAAVLFVVALASLWFVSNHGQIKYTTLYAKRGHALKMKLDDGTTVWLNADSKIKYPETFSGVDKREVFLEGEAYFEVAKDKKHPFLVHTGNLTTRVLGTKFDVMAYNTSKSIEVTLLEGKVMLTAGTAGHGKVDTLYLKPNEKAYYKGNSLAQVNQHDINKGKKTNVGDLSRGLKANVGVANLSLHKIQVENAAVAASWKDDRIIFENELLENVLASLNRRYNVSIHAKESMLNSTISLDLSNVPVEDILLSITKQLKRETTAGDKEDNNNTAQFKKVGSAYYIE